MKTLIGLLLLVSSALAADADPRLKQIEERRLRVQEEVGRNQEIYWAMKALFRLEAELQALSEQEAKIRAEAEIKKEAK